MAARRDGRPLPSPVRICLLFVMPCLTIRRKKLEHDQEKMPSSKVDQLQIGDVQSLDVDTQSIMQIEVPPWSESYDLSSTEVDGELH